MPRRKLPNVVHVVDVSTSSSPSLELVLDRKTARDFPNHQRYIAAPEHGVDWEQVARASIHPLQVKILDALAAEGGRSLSPNQLAQELSEPLGNVSYHVRRLAEAGLLELAGIEPRRGALEHFYRLTERVE